MTIEELARYDGRDGRSAYIAVSGTIYDVSGSQHWQEGSHEGAHQAGRELTEELKSAPHVRTLIERFPIIGKIENQNNQKQKPAPGISLLSILIMIFVMLLMLATYLLQFI